MSISSSIPNFCVPFRETNGLVDSIIIRNWELREAHVEEIADLSDLRELRIDSRAIQAGAVRALTQIPRLTSVYFTSSAVSDIHAELIARHKNLEALGLFGENISDACIIHVRGMRLRSLGLPCTRISDAGIAQLASGNIADHLRYLDLSESIVTNAAIHYLIRFPLLCELSLRSTSVDDRGISLLSNQFTSLDLSETNITDSCSAALACLTRLKYLALTRTAIGTSTARSCLSLPSLRELDLSNSQVDDSILDDTRFSNLETIHLNATRMTLLGISRLRRTYPTLKVVASIS